VRSNRHWLFLLIYIEKMNNKRITQLSKSLEQMLNKEKSNGVIEKLLEHVEIQQQDLFLNEFHVLCTRLNNSSLVTLLNKSLQKRKDNNPKNTEKLHTLLKALVDTHETFNTPKCQNKEAHAVIQNNNEGHLVINKKKKKHRRKNKKQIHSSKSDNTTLDDFELLKKSDNTTLDDIGLVNNSLLEDINSCPPDLLTSDLLTGVTRLMMTERVVE
jgi:hypothetical protein